jgi:transposase
LLTVATTATPAPASAPARRDRDHPVPNWNLRRRYDDGRHLRRYRRRWIIERTFAWLHSFRRLLVRHERFTSMYCSLLYFAAALIALRRF